MSLIKNTATTNTTEDLLKAPYGQQGANIINNTEPHHGSWYCIIAIKDDTTLDVSLSTVNWLENSTTISTDLDLVTGLPYYGDFTKLTLIDGSVIAYYK